MTRHLMTTLVTVLASVLCIGLLGCRERQRQEGTQPREETPPRAARAQLVSAEGRGVSGVVTFHETADGVRVEANVEGLAPGAHGFHIHQRGDCSAPDFSSAGDHFAPDGNPHGPPGPESHAGDLGNLMADPGGAAAMSLASRDISLDPQSKDSIIGRAVIIHADPDDLVSQPSGNAGARIACGVIERADGD